MTVLLNQEKYQSDRLTFEHQEFEKAYAVICPSDRLTRWYGNEYVDHLVQMAWVGWKLAKGLYDTTRST